MSDSELKPIVYEIEYGTIKVKLDEIMKKKGISTYDLKSKSNIRYQTLQVLQDNSASRIDFEVLAKLCYSLNCKVEDIIEYVPNKNSKEQ